MKRWQDQRGAVVCCWLVCGIALLTGCAAPYAQGPAEREVAASSRAYERTTLELRRKETLQVSGASVYTDLLVLEIRRVSIGAADTRWFTLAIFQAGQEVQREVGRRRTAQLPGVDDLWWNVMMMFPKVAPPYEVVVLDQVLQRRTVFRVAGYGLAAEQF